MRFRFLAASIESNGMSNDARILVVDDSEMSRGILLRQLAKIGYRNVAAAASGEEALAALQREAFAAVLCDLNLGDMSALDVIRRHRTQGLEGSAFLVITADADSSEMDAIRESGAAGVLLKPVQVSELDEKLSAVLR